MSERNGLTKNRWTYLKSVGVVGRVVWTRYQGTYNVGRNAAKRAYRAIHGVRK